MAVTDLPRTRWSYDKTLRKIVLKPDCFVFVTRTAPDTFFVPVRSFQGPDWGEFLGFVREKAAEFRVPFSERPHR